MRAPEGTGPASPWTATSRGGPRVFVGRDRPLAQLPEALSDAMAGRSRIAFVEGPAGIGKTALVREFVNGVDGVFVLMASGEEIEEGLAFGVVEQLALRAGPAGADVLSTIRDMQPGDINSVAAGTLLLDLLGRLQEDAPLLMLIDDAHWADLPSLQALTFVMRRLEVDRVLVVVVARTGDGPVLTEGLWRLLEDGPAVRMRIIGLETSEVRDLCTPFREAGRRPHRCPIA